MQNNKNIGMAIDELCEPPSMAQSIRDAVISGRDLCEVLWHICESFSPFEDWLQDYIQSRIFMLFVAEALE